MGSKRLNQQIWNKSKQIIMTEEQTKQLEEIKNRYSAEEFALIEPYLLEHYKTLNFLTDNCIGDKKNGEKKFSDFLEQNEWNFI
jgi:hypothetical protein